MKLFGMSRGARRDATVGIYAPGARLAVVLVRREAGQPPILERAEVAGGEDLGAALPALARAAGLGAAPAVGVLGLDDYQLVLVEAPEVPAEELSAAVRWRLADLVDTDIEASVVDVFPVPQRSGGAGHMVYAVLAPKAQVSAMAKAMQAADLPVTAIDIPELALRNIAELLPEDVGGVAMLYLDAGQGVITLSRQGTLYLTRRVDIGSEALRHRGPGPIDDELRELLEGLVVELQRSLDYYESHFAQPPASAVVISPLPVAMDGLADHLAGQLGLRVRMLDLGELIDCRQPLPPAAQSDCLLALGAALRQGVQA